MKFSYFLGCVRCQETWMLNVASKDWLNVLIEFHMMRTDYQNHIAENHVLAKQQVYLKGESGYGF